jgi:hypothetical protein
MNDIHELKIIHRNDLLLLIHVVYPDTYRPSVSLKLFDLGELHNSIAHVSQTLGCQIRAGDMLDK